METKTFRTSEIINNMREGFAKNPLRKEEDSKEEQFPLNYNLLNKALLRICDLWNKDDKSRWFVKHLIGNFLPINAFNKILNFSEEDIKNGLDRDCILGIKLAGIYSISKELGTFTTEKMMATARAVTEGKKELNPEDVKKLKDIKAKLPIEIRNASFAFCADKSNKYLCRESINALLIFTEHALLNGEKEIEFLLNKKRISESQQYIKKEKRLNNKQVNKVVKASTFGMTSILDEETIAKLKGLQDA